jgi:riboflavin synthase
VFTGIVRECGRVVAVDGDRQGIRLRVAAPGAARDAGIGDSISVSGVCLTVVSIEDGALDFDAVAETLQRSSLGRLAAGDAVNVEPALRAGEPLGGHYVQGHVDGVGRVEAVEREGESVRMTFAAPAEVVRYCVEKGSIAVEGVSLTITDVAEDGFGVALVPHTLAATTLGQLRPGDEVNLEADVLAKYVERLVAQD